MSLKNIQRSKQKVLNRPMFAKMKDGTIKPVQYHFVGAAIGLGARGLHHGHIEELKQVGNMLCLILNKVLVVLEII